MKKSAHCGYCDLEIYLPEKGKSVSCHECQRIIKYDQLIIRYQKTSPDDDTTGMSEDAFCSSCTVMINTPEKGKTEKCHRCGNENHIDDVIFKFQKYSKPSWVDNIDENDIVYPDHPDFKDDDDDEDLESYINEIKRKLDDKENPLSDEDCEFYTNELKSKLSGDEDVEDEDKYVENELSQDELDEMMYENKAITEYWAGRNGGSRSSCFIATATMGDINDPKVMELRTFRDEWILKKAWGEHFVRWYYVHGKRAAKFIEKRTVLKKLSYYFIIHPLLVISRLLKK